MEDILTKEELIQVSKQYGYENIIDWEVKNASENLIGYLGEHLKLIITTEVNGKQAQVQVFIKCIPRSDQWKADYIRELTFFKKEYVTLKEIFQEFQGDDGPNKWRPKVLLLKEELFVFEDLNLMGYKMPGQYTMSLQDITAVVESMARFHVQTFIYEERMKSKLNKSYSIWDDFSEYLREPDKGKNWRTAGLNAVIEYLKVYSKYKSRPNFVQALHSYLPKLYNDAIELMKPSSKYRNAVVHRDLWPNNIFLKHDKGNDTVHAVIIDFQTVLYCSPMLDLSSFLYFNTRRHFRACNLSVLLDVYFKVFSDQLREHNILTSTIFDRKTLLESYEDSLVFGLTQASIIVPIVSMENSTRNKLFNNPESCKQINEVSRSAEIIQVARTDDRYRECLTELFDEIVERYIIV